MLLETRFIEQVYNVFLLLWSLAAVSAWTDIALAGAVADWYWTRPRPESLPPRPLAGSIQAPPAPLKPRPGSPEKTNSAFFMTGMCCVQRATRFHLGTAVAGSAILAVVRLVRLAVEYCSNRLNRASSTNKVSASTNPLLGIAI